MKTLVTSLLLLISVFSFAAPDLSVTVANLNTPSVYRGQNVAVTATVKNIGSSIAAKSMVGYYIKPLGATEWILMGVTSIKKLNPSESVTVEILHPVNNSLASGTYYVGARCDVLGEITETNETNMKQLAATLTINSIKASTQKVPYPYIFIHGLCGDAATWNEFASIAETVYGWQYGGTMNFNLNYDYDNKKSNIATDYKDFNNPLSIGDYYAVNFATDLTGNSYDGGSQKSIIYQSNQAGIVKQGRAIRDAIKHVMDITGSDKVILVGHSMGGLAARECLQNTSNYQADGRHHVAKLFTIGTPHGGSNLSGAIFLGYFKGVDEQSEAVRDLRYEAKDPVTGLSIFSGRYLGGGVEGDRTVSVFYNSDINCNGYVGDGIVGLNSRFFPLDIDYACAIGVSSVSKDDGVVDAYRANIKNYLNNANIQVDTFLDRVSSTNGFIQHTELQKRFANNMLGMDEPSEFNRAFKVETNRTYWGVITRQSGAAKYKQDYDDYRLVLGQKGGLRIRAYNIPVEDFTIDLVNSKFEYIKSISASGKGNIDTTITNLEAGVNYYLEVSGTSDDGSVYFPYAFRADYVAATTPTDELTDAIHITMYPNPASEKVIIDATDYPSPITRVSIADMAGKTLKTEQINQNVTELNVSDLPTGLYLATINDTTGLLKTIKLIVNR